MADFTRQEQLNALSQILRGQLNPTKSGGTLDTDQEYAQLQEMTSISFLLFPKAIFHLGRRAANRLQQTVAAEVALIEDILVALDNLGQIGKPFTNTSLLSDANTALLGLDAAASVQGRPEAQRFNRIMDQIAGDVRKNVVSSSNQLVRPREESRNVIKADFERLKATHDKLLAITFALRDLVDVYNALDLPAKVASTAFANIRTVLATLEEDFETATEAENIAMSRTLLLSSLTNKVVVTLVDAFSDPSNVKYKSPNDPEPPNLKHTGQAALCTPAAMTTSEAPWTHPRLEDLQLAVDGGAPQTVNLFLANITGAQLTAENEGPYEIAAGNEQIHVIVDPVATTYVAGASVSVATVPVTLGAAPLRFKHLGAPVSLNTVTPGFPVLHVGTDFELRSITFLQVLQTFTSIDGGNGVIVLITPLAGAEGAVGLKAAHVGDYLTDLAGVEYEITFVFSTIGCRVDLRGGTFSPGVGTTLRGSSDLSSNLISFAPFQTVAVRPAGTVTVGPTIKTATLSTGTVSVDTLVSDIEAEVGVFSTLQTVGTPLNLHVKAINLNNRLVLMPRNGAFNPYLQMSDKFLVVPDVVGPAVSVLDTAHIPLGLPDGKSLQTRFDNNAVFTAEDFIALVSHYTTGIDAALLSEVITTGSALETDAATKTVRDTTQDFVTLGVTAGYLVAIGSGSSAGVYQVVTVTITELVVDRVTDFLASEAGLSYSILRERVTLSSQNVTNATSIEAQDGVDPVPVDLGLPPTIQYGTSVEFEAVTKQGTRLSFDLAEDDDVLKLPGLSPVEILNVDGTTLELETPIPSNTVGVPFTVRSKMGEEYDALKADLVTFTTSRTLLKQNKFDESLDAIDAALTSAVLPGQNFASSRNNASRLLGDLMGLFTTEPLRFNEHGVTPTPASLNLTDILVEFTPPAVKQLDDLIRTFRERKYERSVDLLLAADLNNFYGTNSETASYGGAMMDAARNVVSDLPNPLSSQEDVEDDLNFATTMAEITDADSDFSDTDGEFEIDDG